MNINELNQLDELDNLNIDKNQHNQSSTSNSTQTNSIINESKLRLIYKVQNENLDKIYNHYKQISKIGNIYVLYWKGNEPYINIGPDWLFFISMNIIIFYMFAAYMYFLGAYFSSIYMFISYFLYISHVVLYCSVSLINPGIPSLNENMEKEYIERGIKYQICNKCKLISTDEATTTHCCFCNRKKSMHPIAAQREAVHNLGFVGKVGFPPCFYLLLWGI